MTRQPREYEFTNFNLEEIKQCGVPYIPSPVVAGKVSFRMKVSPQEIHFEKSDELRGMSVNLYTLQSSQPKRRRYAHVLSIFITMPPSGQ